MRRCLLLIFIGLLASAGVIGQQSSYAGEVKKWRAAHQAELLTDDGWFTIAGLFWLNEGVNTVGRGVKYDVGLTPSYTGDSFGTIIFKNGTVTLQVDKGVDARVDGDPVSTIDITPNDTGKPVIVNFGSESFFVIKREDRYGIRLRDTRNPPRVNFTGLKWFPIDRSYRVTAHLEAYPAAKNVDVPNVIGGKFVMQSPGLLHFTLHGKAYTLLPVIDEDKLFIIFRDTTSKTDTYGSGRFLYADMPVNGEVVLDFNRAENPPCAFTSYATCPLPPQQNRLVIPIRAGEKRYSH